MSEYGEQNGQEDLLNLDEILQAFGVENWSNLGLLNDAHQETLQVLVDIAGQRYVLRERPEGLVGQESQHPYLIRQHLMAAGLPFAPLKPTPQGESFVTVGTESFELYAWRDGEPFASTDKREKSWLAAAGSMLGEIHQVSRQYSGPRFRWPSEVQAGGLTQGWLNFARERVETCENNALALSLDNLVNAWEQALPGAMMGIGTGRDLPELHIHGDYSPANLRFLGQEISEVQGLEASRWEKRLLEVAYAVFSFAGLNWSAHDSLTRPLVKRGLDPIRASQFLGAYSAVFPSVPGEATLLVDALTLIAPIVTVNGPLEDLFFGDIGGHDEHDGHGPE